MTNPHPPITEADNEAAEAFYQKCRQRSVWNEELQMYEYNVPFDDVFLAGIQHARASQAALVEENAALRSKLEITEEALREIIEHELYHGINQGRDTVEIARAALREQGGE